MYREDLDALVNRGCGKPGCDCLSEEMFLHGRCHIGDGIEVAYRKKDGALSVRCRNCKQTVAVVAVAVRPRN